MLFIGNVARIHATLESKRSVSLVYTISISETRWIRKQPRFRVRLDTLLEYFQLTYVFKQKSWDFSNYLSRAISKWLNTKIFIAWKVSKYGDFSCPYFPVFGLNTAKYAGLLRNAFVFKSLEILIGNWRVLT